MDDDPFNLYSLEQLIKKTTSTQIDTAQNGQEALEVFMKEPESYKLIIMDMNMPLMNGKEATLKLRRLHSEGTINLEDTKIYLHSAIADLITETEIFDGVLSKPMNVSQL